VKKEINSSSKLVSDNMPDICHYNNSNLILKEKTVLVTWHKSLVDCGATGMMVNLLEMVVKFSNEIVKEKDIKVPPHMTWMDGLTKGDPDNPLDVSKYGLKILFVLMCSPRATDKKLKSLDDFLNGSEFCLDSIASMSAEQILHKIHQMGVHQKMHIIYSKLSKK